MTAAGGSGAHLKQASTSGRQRRTLLCFSAKRSFTLSSPFHDSRCVLRSMKTVPGSPGPYQLPGGKEGLRGLWGILGGGFGGRVWRRVW